MKGRLEYILGAMSSGKSEFIRNKLMRRIIAGYKVQHFVPSASLRDDDPRHISAGRGKYRIDFNLVSGADEILDNLESVDAIGIDELHFYDKSIMEVIDTIVNKGIEVYTSCLDPTFRGEAVTFKDSETSVYKMIPMAEKTIFMTAICTHADKDGNICGNKEARWNQKYHGNEVAPYDSPLIETGDIEPCDGTWYAPRCREHFKFYKR